jgi:hypothetical protein
MIRFAAHFPLVIIGGQNRLVVTLKIISKTLSTLYTPIDSLLIFAISAKRYHHGYGACLAFFRQQAEETIKNESDKSVVSLF